MHQSAPTTEWTWSARRERAAGLVAEDQLSDQAISDQVGVSKRTLENWKRVPAFAARVEELVAAARERVRAEGIANRANRVAAANRRWLALQAVLDARGADPLMAEVPGGPTGLLVRQAKLVKVYGGDEAREGDDGDGEELVSLKRSQVMYEYTVDTGTLRELRELERHAAQDLGQWAERQEHTGEGGGPLLVQVVKTYEGEDDSHSGDPAVEGAGDAGGRAYPPAHASRPDGCL